MVWRTSKGKRTLCGPLAELIQSGLAVLLDDTFDESDDGEQCETGIAIYDAMTWQQRLASLHDVGSALLRPDVRAPRLTAVNEATVAAIFAVLFANVECELEFEGDATIRGPKFRLRRLLRACAPQYAPALHCHDIDNWYEAVDTLLDEIAWDRDWEMTEFLDMPPDLAQMERDRLTIDDEYFRRLPRDLRDDEILPTWRQAFRLVGMDFDARSS
jgi:hypothetical protein